MKKLTKKAALEASKKAVLKRGWKAIKNDPKYAPEPLTPLEELEVKDYVIRLPEKLHCLMQPATTEPGGGRFKVIYGGRGSAKSMSIAQSLLQRGFERKLKILCAREIQNSIKDSVHALLKECIEMLGMQEFYDVTDNSIRGGNGTEFIFKGLRFNSSEIKSMQGIDICWIEEADKVSAASWKYLIPTIRAEYEDGTCSEIIVSFNPELEEDFTYQNFVVEPPRSAIVVEMNYTDNPWFPKVLEAERQEAYSKAVNEYGEVISKRRLEEYQWIWEGRCKSTVEGAVYAEELAIATAEGRIGSVPVLRGVPVDTYWDLGRNDINAIWFIQSVGAERRAVDYYENSGYHVDHYLEVLQERGYVYGTHHLPHDADHKLLAAKKSIREQVAAEGLRRVLIVDRPPRKNLGINAGRTVFARTWFDREKCADGLAHLRRYHFAINPKTNVRSLEPVHDEHSNCADAWQTFGLAERPTKRQEGLMPPPRPTPRSTLTRQGWMR